MNENPTTSKILIIEDNEDIQEILKVVLIKEGYQIFQRSSIKEDRELLKILNEDKPDLIILDLQMPDHSGIEITYFLKSLICNPIPIILYSAHPNLMEKAESLGAVAAVSKSGDYKPLLAKVKEILETKEA